jgi:uncharacterized membrane protein YfcA
MGFAITLAIVAFGAGTIAAVAGFGIGSILTPVIAFHADTKIAVAAVSIPHLLGTVLRFWRLRRNIDWNVFMNFGIASAAGGLIGAVLHARVASPSLTVLFGGLLVFAGMAGLTGFSSRMRFGTVAAYIAGTVSGAFGGLVGNQGGVRSAAMLGFPIPKESFVATATAIALIVDAARIPVYFLAEGPRILELWPAVSVSAAGVLVGTLSGERILRRVPEVLFRRLVSLLILALGLFELWQLRS